MGKAPNGEKQISGIERCYPSMVLEVISVYIRILLKAEKSFTPKVQIITAIMYLIPLEATGPSLVRDRSSFYLGSRPRSYRKLHFGPDGMKK